MGALHAHVTSMNTRTAVVVPNRNPDLFADRIVEARALCELAKGSADEEICWNYYTAVVGLARIARGGDGKGHLELRDFLNY